MNKDELRKWSEKYAESKGFKLNPDKALVHKILNGLLENERRHGFRYCPCRVVTGDLERDRANICPCSFHVEEIQRWGHCLCKLFVKGS